MDASIDPFSKITVKSKNAIFQKDEVDKSTIRLQYKDNVQVTFADSTTVSSDKLEIFVATEKSKKFEHSSADVKRVVFKNNVRMNRQNQKVQADEVEVIVSDERCELRGHVKIEQVKVTDKDIPLTTECDRAQIAWNSQEIQLIGSERKPVSTVIELRGKLRKFRRKS